MRASAGRDSKTHFTSSTCCNVTARALSARSSMLGESRDANHPTMVPAREHGDAVHARTECVECTLRQSPSISASAAMPMNQPDANGQM